MYYKNKIWGIMKAYIYYYFDKVKNKIIYVGKTNGNCKYYKTGSKILKRYISIYGFTNFDNRFDRNIIKHYPVENLNEMEEYWIEFYDTHINGLNLTKGGRYDWDRSPIHKPILQYDLEGNFIREWDYAKQPIIEGICTDYNGISACCLGNQHSSNGYIWRFKENNIFSHHITPPIKKTYKKGVKRKKNQPIEIEGKIYKSVTSAAKDLGWSFGKLNGRIKNNKIKYRWIK